MRALMFLSVALKHCAKHALVRAGAYAKRHEHLLGPRLQFKLRHDAVIASMSPSSENVSLSVQ